jgi:thymidylate kinase
MTLVVELCGLPGSGKTTLARHAVRALRERDMAARVLDAPISADVPRLPRVGRRAGLATCEYACHPVRATRTARLLGGGRQPVRDDVAGLVQWLAVRQLVARARRGTGVGLLEEGVAQTMWTLLLRSDRDPPVSWWQVQPPGTGPDLVVLVDVPVALSATRLAARASRHSRTQQLHPALRRAELEHGDRLLRSILALSPVPVVPVDAVDAGPEALGRRVAGLVLEQLRERLAAPAAAAAADPAGPQASMDQGRPGDRHP